MQFYVDRVPFERELQLFNNPAVRPLMWATIDAVENAEGKLRAPNGYVWPPSVIHLWGKPINAAGWERMTGSEASFVLSGAADALRRLHAVGYAHRNLCPGNILRLGRKKPRIALVDYGYAAAKGVLPLFGCISFGAYCCLFLKSFQKLHECCDLSSHGGTCICVSLLSAPFLKPS
jgi:hypothetical protein